MRIVDCFEQGLLKQDRSDLKKSLASIDRGSRKLNEANRLLAAGFSEEAVLYAYTAMFHAGRALLYRDGVKENSHYGLFVYLKERYGTLLEARFMSELDALRQERHELMYGLESRKYSALEVQDVLKVANDFCRAIQDLIKK
ncbi:HEPN domain-containing protein [Candidatus Woesearchaeota archaeon]|nr:HEPN domain-containing protein [Candidatus Woesearchaeota archaeon]